MFPAAPHLPVGAGWQVGKQRLQKDKDMQRWEGGGVLRGCPEKKYRDQAGQGPRSKGTEIQRERDRDLEKGQRPREKGTETVTGQRL